MFAAALFTLALGATDIDVLSSVTFTTNGWVYRIYDIDAPKPGVGAMCDLERARAADTAAYIHDLLASAQSVEVRPGFDPRGRAVWPHDRAGRRLARVSIDGQDLAAILIAEGRAVPFDARQIHNWCGR